MRAEGKTWTEFGPFRLGALSKPFGAISVLGAIILCYAGIQPPFDPLVNPIFKDLPFPINWLTNPLIFIGIALLIGWFASAKNIFARSRSRVGTVTR